MTTEEIIHVYENSRLVTEFFTEEAVTAAYVEGLAALRAQQEREDSKPLTLDELREMDGEPVWDNFLMEWCVIVADFWYGKGAVKYYDGGFNLLSENRFYRHKPKEGMKNA